MLFYRKGCRSNSSCNNGIKTNKENGQIKTDAETERRKTKNNKKKEKYKQMEHDKCEKTATN